MFQTKDVEKTETTHFIILRDLGTNFPPIIVINSQPPIQQHYIIGWSELQQEITVRLYIAPSAYDRDS